MKPGSRVEILRAHGARGQEVEELLAYTEPAFDVSPEDRQRSYPPADEECVAAWDRYRQEAQEIGVFESLRLRLVQLRFPIVAGISETPTYRAATRRGELPPAAKIDRGLELREPDGLRLFIHPTPAGRIPILIPANRTDFVALQRALTKRNEPQPILASVGATMIAGYNNWGRILEYRNAWQRRNPSGDWSAGFRELIPRKHLYQDRFVLLSRGPYSDVPASSLGFSDEEWLRKSEEIRLEHECTHYFTRRIFGSMKNSLHDELLADYMGIVAAAGSFRAAWFLRFLGLEDYPRYRESGRLGNYRGDPPLSDGAFKVLKSLVWSAASNLEAADRHRSGALGVAEKAHVLCVLASLTVEEIASDEGAAQLEKSLREVG